MASLSKLLKDAMSEDPFDKAIYTYQKARFEKEKRDFHIGEVHPSFYNGCGRKLQLSWIPGAKPKFPGVITQDVFDNGTYTHLRLQKIYQAAGIISEAEIPLRDKKRGILGTMDGRLLIPRKGILEIKSINSFSFSRLMGPLSAHKNQGILYFHLSEEDFILFVYENKDCVPGFSRALTKDGWKFHYELRVGEDILTYCQKTHCMMWQPVKKINVYDSDGSLLCLGTRKQRFLFTPNHRWPVQDYKGCRRFVRGDSLRSTHWLMYHAPYEFQKASLFTPREAEILGWIASDGWIAQRRYQQKKSGRLISYTPDYYICQKDGVKASRIRALLAKDAIHYHYPHRVGCENYWRIVGRLRRKLSKLVPTKSVLPSIVSRLNEKALLGYVSGLLGGDGSWSATGEKIQFCQRDGLVKESFQIACLLLGNRVNINRGKLSCYPGNRNYLRVLPQRISSVSYQGDIWCPTVENGAWVMESEGKCIITGNSQVKKKFELYRNEAEVKRALRVIQDAQEAFHEKRLLPKPKEATGPGCEMCHYCPFSDYCHSSYNGSKVVFPDTKMVGKHVVLADTKRKSLLNM